MQEIGSTWYTIVNPHAGSGKTVSEWSRAETLLEERSIPYVHVMTRFKRHAEDLAIEAASKGYRRFLAVGGDGTVHEVLNGIMHYLERDSEASISDFFIAVIPIGSGNDWIKSHNVPHDTAKVLDLVKAESFMGQDVVRVSHLDSAGRSERGVSYMLNIGGTGLDSRVCEIVNSQKDAGKSGKLLYLRALLKVIRNMNTCPVSVWGDDEKVFEGSFLSIAFGIGKYSGGGMRQCPHSLLDDGLADMTIIPGKPLLSILPHVFKIYSGKLTDVRWVLSGKFRKIEVFNLSGKPESMESDGEIVTAMPFRLEVLPGKINALTNAK